MIRKLKRSGVKVVINTTAGRELSVSDLNCAGILQYTDMLVCGDDDPTIRSKSAHTTRLICDELGTVSI